MAERGGSMRAQVIGIGVIVAIVGGIGLLLAMSGAMDNPVIHFRNESSQPVSIGIVGTNGFHDQVVVVPPWTKGTCLTAEWAMGAGNKPASAVFANGLLEVADPIDFPAGGPYFVRVDSSGTMHVGESIPNDPPDCTMYVIGDGLQR